MDEERVEPGDSSVAKCGNSLRSGRLFEILATMKCMKSSSMGLRCGVLLAFMVGMPLLAYPPVADNIGSLMPQWFQPVGPQFEIASVDSPAIEKKLSPVIAVQPEPSKTAVKPHEKPPIQQVSVEAIAPVANDQDLVLNQRIAEVNNRLKRWGGTDCALERVESEEPRFRFACKVPLAANSPYSRPFEAVERDPYVAMNRVLMQVEGWRNAQAGAGDPVRR